jgi:hypothetical protein
MTYIVMRVWVIFSTKKKESKKKKIRTHTSPKFRKEDY